MFESMSSSNIYLYVSLAVRINHKKIFIMLYEKKNVISHKLYLFRCKKKRDNEKP